MKKFLCGALASLVSLLFSTTFAIGAEPGGSGVPIVLTAFGTSTKAGIVYEVIEKRVKEAFPENPVHWAFTSEIIRKKMNAKWEAEGNPKRYNSLDDVLAAILAGGAKTAVVQPLHVFPGEEYEEALGAAGRFQGLRVETGGALFQRWEDMYEIIGAHSGDFLSPEAGSNIIVAHGTPSTDKPSNIAILGLDRYLLKRFPNVFLGAVDGAVTSGDAIEAAVRYPVKKARFIPLMIVAGDHIMNDIMGDEPGSWKSRLHKGGVSADCPTITHGSEEYYKSLGFLPETSDIFIRMIRQSLSRLEKN